MPPAPPSPDDVVLVDRNGRCKVVPLPAAVKAGYRVPLAYNESFDIDVATGSVIPINHMAPTGGRFRRIALTDAHGRQVYIQRW